RLLVTSLVLPALALADNNPTSSVDQLSEPFVDQITGLPMERFVDPWTSFAFAFALPEAQQPASLIGQLSLPLVDGQGWGFFGLGDDSNKNAVLAVWPDGQGGVTASFRQSSHINRPPVVKTDFQVRPLPDGIFVNETLLTYTFLCENCLDVNLERDDETGDAVMAWGLSGKRPRGRATDNAARLGSRERGFGLFTARLGEAKTTDFDAVAATALDAVPAVARVQTELRRAIEDDVANNTSGDETDGVNGNSDNDANSD
ncbi:hypothetical protein B0I35DRAFT_344236, partial [Stachybotrys elegans]